MMCQLCTQHACSSHPEFEEEQNWEWQHSNIFSFWDAWLVCVLWALSQWLNGPYRTMEKCTTKPWTYWDQQCTLPVLCPWKLLMPSISIKQFFEIMGIKPRQSTHSFQQIVPQLRGPRTIPLAEYAIAMGIDNLNLSSTLVSQKIWEHKSRRVRWTFWKQKIKQRISLLISLLSILEWTKRNKLSFLSIQWSQLNKCLATNYSH